MYFARQRALWRRAELTQHEFRKSYQTAGPIDTKFGTHVQIHFPKKECTKYLSTLVVDSTCTCT